VLEKTFGVLAHLPALRDVPGFEVTALSTSSPESAARAGEVHGVARTFGNATDLAACDEVDLVVVSVKVPKHRELVTQRFKPVRPSSASGPWVTGWPRLKSLPASPANTMCQPSSVCRFAPIR